MRRTVAAEHSGPGSIVPFIKGHGTGNDFIVLPDLDGRLELTPRGISRLCDRRRGLGADGVLRLVRSADVAEASGMAAEAEWFMDYRNADGSSGSMCGNGIRVLARHLVDSGLCPAGRFGVATRAGVRRVEVPEVERGPGSDVRVWMGRPVVRFGVAESECVEVVLAGRRWPARRVGMGNPHAVVLIDDVGGLGDVDGLGAFGGPGGPPVVEPASAFPEGVTVEFVVRRGRGRLALRVHERGVGETLSCGTGACAAVAVVGAGEAGRWTVDVPGGRLRVEVLADGAMVLGGAAELVARGYVEC